MDKLLNNEALVCCIAYRILKECPCDFAKLSILLTLIMDDSIRQSIMHRDSLFFEETVFKRDRAEAIDRIYLEMLPICLNSIVILIQEGLIETENNIMQLTEKGAKMAGDIQSINSYRLKEISGCTSQLISMTYQFTAADLFKTLKLSV